MVHGRIRGTRSVLCELSTRSMRWVERIRHICESVYSVWHLHSSRGCQICVVRERKTCYNNLIRVGLCVCCLVGGEGVCVPNKGGFGVVNYPVLPAFYV